MRTTTRWVAIRAAACMILLAAATSTFAQSVAIVVDRIGSVTVDGAASETPVPTLSRWPSGTRLRLPEFTSVRLLFVATGEEFNVTGRGAAVIGDTGVVASDGAVVQKKTAVVGERLRLRSESVAMGGVVMRGMGVRATSPRGLLTRLPKELVWEDLVVDETYIVRIREESGRDLFERRVQGLSTPFPSVPLAPGTRYVWSVVAERAPERKPASTTFELAAPTLQADAARMEPGAAASFADRAEFALWLEHIGATSETVAVWKRLAQERPDDEVVAARARR